MSLFGDFHLSAVHQGIVMVHVLAAILSLVVAPVAMWVRKGGRAHRQWGKVYFWGMFVANTSAFVLLYYRFNVFLLGVTIISLYGAISGYRAPYRKRPGETKYAWFDWTVTSATLVGGAGLLIVGVSVIINAPLISVPGLDDGYVGAGLMIGFGLMITQSAYEDIKGLLRPSNDKMWWWYHHMNAMLGSYIGLTTALMVQQVGPRLPQAWAWMTWVAPGVIGSIIISRWVAHYRRKFDRRDTRPAAAVAAD